MEKWRYFDWKSIILIVRKFRLQKRFLWLVVFAVILPLLFLEAVTFYSVKRVFQLSNYESMQQELDSYNQLVNSKLEEYSSAGNKIATSLYTIKLLEKTSTDKELKDFIQINEYNKLLEQWTGELSEFIAVEVINKKGFISYRPYQFVEENLKSSILFSEIMSSEERQSWLGAYRWENENRYSAPPVKQNLQYPLICSTKVKGAYSSEYLGCVNLYVKRTLLNDMVADVLNYRQESNSLFREDEIFFIDHNSKIISHVNDLKVGTFIEEELKENLIKNKIGDPKSKIVYLNGGKDKKIVFFSESNLTGMRMIAFVDYEKFYQNINQIFKIMVVFSSFILLIAGGVSWVYFFSIMKPIDMIVLGMKQVEKNDFTVVVADDGKDELNDLIQRFNKMVSKSNELIQQKIEMERKKKDAELRILEEQINPHFLYNTLDMINWIAYEKKEDKICHIVKMLSDFYRIGLNLGERIYTVGEEIKHVAAYIEIQRERFQGKISYYFDIQEDIYQYRMVKLVLQPLVENAVVHGIMPKGTGGNIWISVYREEGDIVFNVRDDGVGIVPQKLLKERTDQGGYGIQNVDARIKMYFGNKYGVKLENVKDGGGAISVVKIPAIKAGGEMDEDFADR